MPNKLQILFLCTGNSCRSQMAEGWARHLKAQTINAYSAGIEINGLNQNAIKVMAEAGVDISQQKSKHVDAVSNIEFDAVITLCGHAHETCPIFRPNCKIIHMGFADPPALAKQLALTGANQNQQLDCYRQVRDEIKTFITTLPASLKLANK